MPHFEIFLFVEGGKSEKYSINLCVSSMIYGGKKCGLQMGEGFNTILNT